MSQKTITVCDNPQCGTPIISSTCYTISLESGSFMDAAGSRDRNYKRLDFCPTCAVQIKQSLENIEKALTEGRLTV